MKYFKVLIIALAPCSLFGCGFLVFIFYRQDSFIESLVPQPNIYQRPFQNYSVRTVLPQYPVESTATKKVDVTNPVVSSSSPAGNLEEYSRYFLIGQRPHSLVSHQLRLPSIERLKNRFF